MKRLLIGLIFLIPLNVWALEFPQIVSDYAIVYDLTSNEVLFQKNSDTETSVASLTKILTTITAIEEIPDLEETVTITDAMLANIYWDASVAGLKVGDVVTYRDLLYATILPSGADAAQVLAISLAGDTNSFVSKMNKLAKRIGMNNSNFVNTSGLDQDGQYSTADDMRLLLEYALDNSVFRDVYTTKSYVLKNGLVVKATIKMYEKKLNIDTSRILGSKTGTTEDAGLCLSSLFQVQNHEILIITIHAPYDNNFYNLKDNLNLIAFMDNNYEVKEIEEERPKEEIKVPEISENIINDRINVDYKLLGIIGLIIFLVIILFLGTKKRKKKGRKRK